MHLNISTRNPRFSTEFPDFMSSSNFTSCDKKQLSKNCFKFKQPFANSPRLFWILLWRSRSESKTSSFCRWKKTFCVSTSSSGQDIAGRRRLGHTIWPLPSYRSTSEERVSPWAQATSNQNGSLQCQRPCLCGWAPKMPGSDLAFFLCKFLSGYFFCSEIHCLVLTFIRRQYKRCLPLACSKVALFKSERWDINQRENFICSQKFC